MIDLIQLPWSPFCIVQRRILEFADVPFKLTNIPSTDRSLVWKLTRERYYGVPIIRDGRQVIFEVNEESQVIAKYINEKYSLGLFPQELRGVQSILWLYIENEIEGRCFRLNDIYYKEFVPKKEQLEFLRFKERKFGRGCVEKWRDQQNALVKELEEKLVHFEQMLVTRPFLLDVRPRFVDFNLYGMLGNLLYTGHHKIPRAHTGIEQWYERMTKIKNSNTREKLRS